MIFIRTIDTKGKLKCITGTCLLHVNAISSVPGWYLPSENGQGDYFKCLHHFFQRGFLHAKSIRILIDNRISDTKKGTP